MNVNKVILVGRLTRDPDMRTTTSGQQVATISMATNNFWTDKGGKRQEKTEYHTVILWGRLAEISGQYLTKGQECYIEGRLQTREYTAKDGTERKVTEVVGETMQLGSRAQGSSQGQGVPRGNAPAKMASAGAVAPQKSAPVEEEIPTINLDDERDEIKIEDVPF
ncbi:MAG: single-stranded DNA-binding protein [Candidatus Moranbacteria bacterium]|nr:single-stranded DNA-binding protein [Candidatus Moranbacteria bacterium]